MSKLHLKTQAIILRTQGRSYSQIKKIVKVSKSTLSLWLKDFPLAEERLRALRDWNEIRIEKFRKTMQDKRDERFQEHVNTYKKSFRGLNKKDLFLAGLFLYWGEGLKGLRYALAVYNTDPHMLKFVKLWYMEALEIPASKLKVKLQLYKDMNISSEIQYWKSILALPESQFSKPYIKSTSSESIKYKGMFGHGTCGLLVNDINKKELVMAGLKVISDSYGQL